MSAYSRDTDDAAACNACASAAVELSNAHVSEAGLLTGVRTCPHASFGLVEAATPDCCLFVVAVACSLRLLFSQLRNAVA